MPVITGVEVERFGFSYGKADVLFGRTEAGHLFRVAADRFVLAAGSLGWQPVFQEIALAARAVRQSGSGGPGARLLKRRGAASQPLSIAVVDYAAQ